jgi:hypothetical protein
MVNRCHRVYMRNVRHVRMKPYCNSYLVKFVVVLDIKENIFLDTPVQVRDLWDQCPEVGLLPCLSHRRGVCRQAGCA